MQQKWWLVAAGAIGIALAILLFPKPGTSDLPDPDMTREDPLDFKAQGEHKRPQHIKVARREARPPELIRREAIPGREHLTTPEAIYSGRLSGPWTLVRRQLLSSEDERAMEWAEKLTPLITDLRNRRRDPNAVSWDSLRATQDDLLSEIKLEQGWMELEGVGTQVDRIDDLLIKYDEEKQSGTAPAAVPPSNAPAPAPSTP